MHYNTPLPTLSGRKENLLGCIPRTLGLEFVIRRLEHVVLLKDVLKLRPDVAQLLIDQPDSGWPRVCSVLRRGWFVDTLWMLAWMRWTLVPVALGHVAHSRQAAMVEVK
jgi:hypothetical protein